MVKFVFPNGSVSDLGSGVVQVQMAAGFQGPAGSTGPTGATGATGGPYTGSSWGSGTSFPGSPATNDRFTRTDLGMDFYYDGTRWLSVQLYMGEMGLHPAAVQAFAATNTAGSLSTDPGVGTDLWLINWIAKFFVAGGGTALDASNKWVGVFAKSDSANAATTIATTNIASGASSIWRTDTVAINALLGGAGTYFRMTNVWTKTGTPGNLSVVTRVTYRIVAT